MGERGDDDDSLMARIADGDAEAFHRLVDRHADRVLALARRVLANRADAEDVAQEVFIRLWTRADRYRPGRARFTTWLYRVVVNAALNARRGRVEQPIPDGHGSRETEGIGPEEYMMQNEDTQRLAAALDALPGNQRTAMALTVTRELTNREAAAVMGLSVKALEALLVRARRTLRPSMTETS